MAASMRSKICPLKNLTFQYFNQYKIFVRTGFFDRFRGKDSFEEELKREQREDRITFKERFQGLKKRSGIQTVRGYKPNKDVEQKIQTITNDLYGNSDNWLSTQLEDRSQKFKFLTKCQTEFDHMVTNMDLNSMNTVEDVVTYFKTEVKDSCAYEDISKLDLPKNLHMNMEYSNVLLHSDLEDPNDGYQHYKKDEKNIKYRRKYKAQIDKELEVLQH
ncbi:uncharacterized protein LOC134728343 [Mytilus trossulus]|uniref:uncharacterized protein LOC134728343 n=1 Tax=Mytilus trossulus TaxID=6551 RepID=UPI00300424DA